MQPCAICAAGATTRCSTCKAEYYCSDACKETAAAGHAAECGTGTRRKVGAPAAARRVDTAPPSAPPVLSPFSFSRASALQFTEVADPVSLLHVIAAALHGAGADADADNGSCSIAVAGFSDRGGCTAAYYTVRCFTDAARAVYIAEFLLTSGDAVVMARQFKSALLWIRRCGHNVATVTRLHALPAVPAPPAFSIEDVPHILLLLKNPATRLDGCISASCLAGAVRNSGPGMSACVASGLADAVLGIIGDSCVPPDARTAAATALADWLSSDIGLAAMTHLVPGATRVLEAVAAYPPPPLHERAFRRTAARAAARLTLFK
jgi:MYND finger